MDQLTPEVERSDTNPGESVRLHDSVSSTAVTATFQQSEGDTKPSTPSTATLEKQISEIEAKMKVEMQIHQGAKKLREALKDKTALTQMDISIAESQRRLEFLENEKQKLVDRIQGGSTQDLPAELASNLVSKGVQCAPPVASSTTRSSLSNMLSGSSGLLNRLGFKGSRDRIPSNGSMSTPVPPFRSESLSAMNKKPSLNNLDLSKSSTTLSPEKIAVKLVELKTKCDLEKMYQEAAKKLVKVYADRMDEADKRPLTLVERKSYAEAQRKLKEATDKLNLLGSSLRRYQGMHIEGLADLRELENAAEVSKQNVSGKLVIVVGSVQNLLGKITAKTEAYVSVRIDGGLVAKTKTKSKLDWNESFSILVHKAGEIEFTVHDKNDGLLAVLFFRLADVNAELAAVSGTALNENDDVMQNIWDLEPAGQIKLAIKLNNFATEKADNGINRHAGVRKRKHHIVKGHRFVAQHFYQIMKCALCQEYLVGSVGYRCDACAFLCHKRCHDKVLTKCISRAEDLPDEKQDDQSRLLKHDVPHKFEHTTSVVPNWCSHCGYMLPMGRKGLERCTACPITCHDDCKVYIPNLCGMTMDYANKVLAAVQAAEDAKRIKAEKLKQEALDAERLANFADVMVIDKSAARTPTLDDFHFVAVLGKGNFGKVMLAEEKSTKKLFAIKVLKKSFILQNDEVESTRAEKRVFMAVNRGKLPFLVGLHSCFQSDTRIYFVMEYINGGDLMLHIQRKQFSERQAKFYACEVLLALEFFHKCDIVYRDLKLDNILLSNEGHIKIADYGLCKEQMGRWDTTNTFCGTPEFMAPEILMSQNYHRAVDWWAFGVLIYEMILGQAPFKGQSEDEIFDSIIHDEPYYPSNLSRDAVSLMQKLLNKDPTRRLGSGTEDASEIKNHPYFRGINWDDILNCRVPPPFVPKISNPKDVSNFDKEFTSEVPILTPLQCELDDADQENFKGFSYVAEWSRKSLSTMKSLPPVPPATSLESEKPIALPNANTRIAHVDMTPSVASAESAGYDSNSLELEEKFPTNCVQANGGEYPSDITSAYASNPSSMHNASPMTTRPNA